MSTVKRGDMEVLNRLNRHRNLISRAIKQALHLKFLEAVTSTDHEGREFADITFDCGDHRYVVTIRETVQADTPGDGT